MVNRCGAPLPRASAAPRRPASAPHRAHSNARAHRRHPPTPLASLAADAETVPPDIRENPDPFLVRRGSRAGRMSWGRRSRKLQIEPGRDYREALPDCGWERYALTRPHLPAGALGIAGDHDALHAGPGGLLGGRFQHSGHTALVFERVAEGPRINADEEDAA